MRTIVALFLVLGIAATSCNAEEESGFVFGIKPGSTINSAYFGYKIGNIVPMVGADLLWLSASATYTDESVNRYYDDYAEVWSEYRSVDTDDINGRAILLMPHFGGKIYLGGNDVKPYLYANFFFSIPSVKAEASTKREWRLYYDGELVDQGGDSESEALSKEYEDLIKDILGFWGVTLGGGAEYFLSKHFSVGGEYGLRILVNSVNQSTKDSSGSPTDRYTDEVNTEVSASVKVSYAAVTLNYRF